jgi:hypothetical protein
MLYSQRTAAQRSAVLPDFVSLQYAGSIGFVSGGLGYQLSKATSASIHYGYVPQNKGGALNIVAGKLVYNPYTIRISRNFRIDPIQPGIMISYHFGTEFRTNWPAHRYPEGYYWWKTSLRAHVLTQTSVSLALNDKRIHSLTGYIEFNTNELYLISYIKNHRALNLTDIIKVGYGLRAHF